MLPHVPDVGKSVSPSLDVPDSRAESFGKHFVSITPLRLDLSDEKEFSTVLALPITPAQSARPQNVATIKR